MEQTDSDVEAAIAHMLEGGRFKKICFLLLLPVYGYFVFQILWHASPISVDGSGPMPTFYWGRHEPTPTLREYDTDSSVRFQLMLPYIVAAIIITIETSGVLWWQLRRRNIGSIRRTIAGAGWMFILMLLLAAVSDAGIKFGFWFGPLCFSSLFSVFVLFKIAVPVASLTGVLGAVRPGAQTLNSLCRG